MGEGQETEPHPSHHHVRFDRGCVAGNLRCCWYRISVCQKTEVRRMWGEIEMNKTLKLWRSGLVQRWHQNPEMAPTGQTNGHHQWACASLLLALNPMVSQNLLIFILTHDVGELDAGDLAGPFKREHPDFAERHEGVETMYRHDTLGGALVRDHHLSDHDLLWWRLVDRLEALLYVITHRPDLSVKRQWNKCEDFCMETADELGVIGDVNQLILAARKY